MLGDAEAGAASVADVAREVGISRYHFIRQFQAAFGDTPHQLRTRARLERARELLARGASVTEVCFGLGFASLGSFSGLFTRRLGEPPSAYQRRVRRLAAVGGPRVALAFPGCLALLQWLPAGAFARRASGPAGPRG
jgi:AraC-like DNA-binding protein